MKYNTEAKARTYRTCAKPTGNKQIFDIQHFGDKCFEKKKKKLSVTAITMWTCSRKLMNNTKTLSVCERKSQNFRQSTPFMQLGPHDKPAAEGLGRSAECDSIPHCSSLLTACFFSNSPCSLSEEDRNKSPPSCLPNFNHSQSTCHPKLPTSHCGGARTSKPFVVLFQALYCFRQSLRCFL